MFAKRKVSPAPISLHIILTVPYALLIIVIVTAVVYFSLRNSQGAVNDVAHQLRNETTLRIQEHLVAFLNIPHQINQLNAYALQNGELDAGSTGEIQRYFLEQIRIHPSISSIYFGNSAGGLAGAGREGMEGSLYVTRTENPTSGNFQKFSVDETGVVLFPALAIGPSFDARTRPWFISASQKGDAAWSNIYVLFTGQDMAIAASRPVYDKNKKLLGVVSVDIFLSQLSSFLESPEIIPGGQIFIMERSGALVAASTGEALFMDNDQDGEMERIHASDSQSAVIRHSNSLLLQTYGNYADIPTEEQHIEFTLDDEKQFMQFLSVRDPHGIDWIVVVVTPEAVFMDQIVESGRSTAWLTVIVSLLAIAVSIVATSRIVTRIAQLDASAQALANGEWGTRLDTNTHITEFKKLATSFNTMKEQLYKTMESLTQEIEVRKRVEDALRKSEEKFRALAENVPITVFQCKNDQRYTFFYLNNSVEVLTGYPKEEFIERGMNFFDLYHPDDIPNIPTVYEENKTVINKRPYHISYRIIHKAGEIRWVDEWGTGIVNAAGEVEYIEGIMVDVTERQQIESDLRKYTSELTALQAAMVDISSLHSLPELLNMIVERAAALLDASSGGLYLTDPEQRKVTCVVSYKTTRDFTGTTLDYGVGAAGYVAEKEQPLIINNYAEWPGRADVYEKEQPFHAVMSAPMLWYGRVTGVLHVMRGNGTKKFVQEELDILIMFANHAAAAVESARLISLLEQELKERRQIEEELQTQRDFATQVINLMGQGLAVTDAQGRFEFVNPAYARMCGYKVDDLVGKSPSEVTAPEEQEAIAEQKKLREEGITSTYESRLMRADGTIATVLITGVPRGNKEEYQGSITVITDLTRQKRIEEELRLARDGIEVSNKQLEQALARESRLARTDELTGVHNRRQLFELAERKFAIARRYKQPLAVTMFDIDDFKRVNDRWGHITGDEVLTKVAQLAQLEMRKADLLGRYGGEEFIILSPMTNALQVYVLAERIRMRIADLQIPSGESAVAVTVSMGIAEIRLDDPSESLENLFSRADEAMYEAKQAGRNCTMIY